MAMILAFDVVAPRERWLVQWAGRDASVKSAERSQPLRLNRIRRVAVYHRMGDCHATMGKTTETVVRDDGGEGRTYGPGQTLHRATPCSLCV
jgi:hypothetical protein